MANTLAQLGGTVGVDAAVVSFAFGAHHVAAAHRAALGHMEMLAPAWAVVQHLNNFGDNIAAALHLHPVADAHTQPLNFVHVVQRGAAYGGTADGHGLQPCYRRPLAGAAHLHLDVLDLRFARMRGVLVGYRPARRLSGIARSSCRPMRSTFTTMPSV